jgi:hypothetical protein
VTSACPACGAGALAFEFDTARVSVSRCASSGHRVARHAAEGPAADYHEQYDQGAFLDALQATRIRQARVIVSRIRAAAPDAMRLLDYGCGRGWFLDEAKVRGFDVTGADTSQLAVRLLRERGIGGLLVNDTGQVAADVQVLTLLDVIEHFPPDEILPRLIGLSAAASLVVIKVPASAGILYKAASLLRRAGKAGLIEQLYQAGSSPPHHHYFSARSLLALLPRAGLRPIELFRDRDFEPEAMADRARLWLPRPLVRAAASLAATAARALRIEDSIICLAQPRP